MYICSPMCVYVYMSWVPVVPLSPHPMVMVQLVMPHTPCGMWGGLWRCPEDPPRKGPTHGHASPLWCMG